MCSVLQSFYLFTHNFQVSRNMRTLRTTACPSHTHLLGQQNVTLLLPNPNPPAPAPPACPRAPESRDPDLRCARPWSPSRRPPRAGRSLGASRALSPSSVALPAEDRGPEQGKLGLAAPSWTSRTRSGNPRGSGAGRGSVGSRAGRGRSWAGSGGGALSGKPSPAVPGAGAGA